MDQSLTKITSIPELLRRYDRHLLSVRGLARNTRSLHRHVFCRVLHFCFPGGQVTWGDLRFSDCVAFLKEEFARLSSRETPESVADGSSQRSAILWRRKAASPKAGKRLFPRFPPTVLPLCRGAYPKNSSKIWREPARETNGDTNVTEPSCFYVCASGFAVEKSRTSVWKTSIGETGACSCEFGENHRERVLPLPDDIGQAWWLIYARGAHGRPEFSNHCSLPFLLGVFTGTS